MKNGWRAWLTATAAVAAAFLSPPATANVTPFPVGSVADERCAPADATQLDRTLHFAIYRGRGVAEGEVTAQLKRAAAYYAPHRLRLLRAGATRPLDAHALFEGTSTELSAAIRAAGIDPARPATGARAEAAKRITCEVATAPLRRFLQKTAGDDAIRLVFLRNVAEPSAAIASLLRNMRGLTLSPDDDHDAVLRACLSLSPGDAPVILLGLDAIAARRPGTVDITLIHEIGHVLGLGAHREDAHIMNPEPPRCLPNLSPATPAKSRALPPRRPPPH